MSFSVTEKDYIYKLLASNPSIRPDGRQQYQFRNLEANVNFLPNSNGSSRIRLSEGDEIIVSVKSKVVKFTRIEDLVEIDISIDNLRDDLLFINNWKQNLKNAVTNNLVQTEKLETSMKLTSKYYFKLCIDVMFLSGSRSKSNESQFLTNPVGVISFGIYLALRNTRLPFLISSTNDKEIEELPTFNDDWSSSKLLFDENADNLPCLLFIIAVVNGNLFIDPTVEEQEVSENGLLVTWSSGKVITPIESLNLNQSGDSTYLKGFDAKIITKGTSLVKRVARVVLSNLDSIAKEGNNADFLDSIY